MFALATRTRMAISSVYKRCKRLDLPTLRHPLKPLTTHRPYILDRGGKIKELDPVDVLKAFGLREESERSLSRTCHISRYQMERVLQEAVNALKEGHHKIKDHERLKVINIVPWPNSKQEMKLFGAIVAIPRLLHNRQELFSYSGISYNIIAYYLRDINIDKGDIAIAAPT